MMAGKTVTLSILALAQWACSPVPPDECESMSRAEVVQLAREQKAALLNGSTASERAHFASDVISPPEVRGAVNVVGFKGKDGRTLLASIIYDGKDCLVGFSYE